MRSYSKVWSSNRTEAEQQNIVDYYRELRERSRELFSSLAGRVEDVLRRFDSFDILASQYYYELSGDPDTYRESDRDAVYFIIKYCLMKHAGERLADAAPRSGTL